MVSKLAKQEAAAEKESAAAAAKASSADGTAIELPMPSSINIAGNAAAALQQVWDTNEGASCSAVVLLFLVCEYGQK